MVACGCLTNRLAPCLACKTAIIGTQLQELEVGQLVDLWALIWQLDCDGLCPASGQHGPLSLKHVKWITDHGTTYLDIHITPISDLDGKLLGANLTFIDDTRDVRLEDEHSSSALARATPKLQITSRILDTTDSKLELPKIN